MSKNLKKNTPWNKGKKTGGRKPFSPEHISTLRTILTNEKKWRDLCLLEVALDTSLRSCDFLRLKISDVRYPDGTWKEEVRIVEKKKDDFFIVTFNEETFDVLSKYAGGFADYMYLFQGRKGHLTYEALWHIVRKWCKKIGLCSREYGVHSLRKALPNHAYNETKDIRLSQLMLNHKKVDTTTKYLGIDQKKQFEAVKKYKI